MVRNRWRTFPYAMDDDLSRSHALIPAPHSDNLFELLHSFEDGMEPYDIELSQYIVLEDKVVCFVGTYRESFYNHETGDYKLKRKRHWFGIAYQTSIPYSKMIERYLEARQNYDAWWAKMIIAEKLQMGRFKKEGGDTIMPHHGMERNRIYQKEPLKPWTFFEDYMWHLDGKNWNRSYRVYDYFIEGTNRKDAKERILEQAQKFVSTEPDWFKNARQEVFEKRRGMKKNAETFEANDMVKERYFDKQLKKYKDKLVWRYLSLNPSLTPALIEKYKDKLNWKHLSRNPSLTPALIEKYKGKLNWVYLSINPSLTPALIEKYIDKWGWDSLSKNPSLTPALIEKYIDKVSWAYLSLNPALTPALIEKYKDNLVWDALSENPSLTPALIEKYKGKLDWYGLSSNPSLTPALIEKYKDELSWYVLSRNPSLTPAFIEKYKDKWDWNSLSKNPALTFALIEKYEDKVSWGMLSLNPSLTPAFIEKYKDKWHWVLLSQNPSLFGNLHVKKAEESNNPSAEEILDFVIKQFSKGELTVDSKMIGEHFNIEPKEVQYITNSENVRDKYKVEGESAFGDFFLRYKEIPFQSAYNNGLYYASMKNPWVKARAIGKKYEPKRKRKARLKRILYGAEGIGSKGMLAAGIIVAFTLIPEIKKAFLNSKRDK
jgi:hypothetical protein